MNVEYEIFSPNGNITALVKTIAGEKDRKRIADAIMECHREVEQVGFLGEEQLIMAGGEFCGNASACAAVALWDGHEKERETQLTVSGYNGKVEVKLRLCEDESVDADVQMPSPLAIKEITLPVSNGLKKVTTVFLPGISHCIVEEAMEKAEAEQRIKEWCRLLGVEGLGIMMLSEERQTLTPLVYVPGADTLFWESSCASGSTACGWYCYEKQKGKNGDFVPFFTSFRQPGGTIRVAIEKEQNGMPVLWLSTNVKKCGRYEMAVEK